MTSTIRTERGTFVDVVHSPDDGGWYLSEYNLDGPRGRRNRVSRRIYPSAEAAIAALRSSKAKWEPWS